MCSSSCAHTPTEDPHQPTTKLGWIARDHTTLTHQRCDVTALPSPLSRL
jgi:hypothetical protein